MDGRHSGQEVEGSDECISEEEGKQDPDEDSTSDTDFKDDEDVEANDDADAHNQHPNSLWHRLPTELVVRILQLAGPLTMHLNHFDGTRESQDFAHWPRLVWMDAFDSDWDGDLTLLPFTFIPTVEMGFTRVKSRR
ncbi:hypothetical protein HDV05_001915, partial [Chytridiales sp. JEL 0842]